jgi:16S rRNA (uracil1498-N3)-methyltransferase
LSGCTKVLFYEEAVELWKSSFVSDRIVLCIGPEGGWDPGEIEQAREAAYKIFGLGPRVLRAETAAIAAVSIIRHQIDLLGSESPG